MTTSRTKLDQGASPIAVLKSHGQAIWLDFIRRNMIASGDLARLVDTDGVSGVTSNPTIFEKAIGGSDDYDAQIADICRRTPDLPAREVYDLLASKDIQDVADILRPVHARTSGADGYVSIEVSPGVANDTQATIAEARHLWNLVGRRNLMIKVPGTVAGVPAVRALTAEGINVNITLLFARDMYEAVAHAFIDGLEDRLRQSGSGQRLDDMASVASFFVSRIDTSVDARLTDKLKTAAGGERERLERLFGKVAIANARLAYQSYKRMFAGPRWQALAARGARPQRLLWASTSVKNPRYRDVMYVDELIGPDTVNTVPVETLDAYRDHGRPSASLEASLTEAAATLDDARGGRHLAGAGDRRAGGRRHPQVPGAVRQADGHTGTALPRLAAAAPGGGAQRVIVEIDERGDVFDRDVGLRVRRHVGRVRVVPLAGEDGGQALAPRLLDRGEDPDLVVDQHVVVGRVASLDVVELELLVDVDEHAPGDGSRQAGAFDLQRLKHDVAVGQDDGGPEAAGVRDDVQRAGVEPLRERVVHQERRHGQQVRIARVRLAVALQRPEDVRVAELAAQLLEDLEKLVGPAEPHLAHQVLPEVDDDAVVVEQRVVDVEQEDHVDAASFIRWGGASRRRQRRS